MLGLVTLPGPMRVSGSAVVRVCVHHPCVTVPKRVTEAWEQNSSCQHAVTGGRERAQSPHTPAYRDLWRAGAGEQGGRPGQQIWHFCCVYLNLPPFLFSFIVIVWPRSFWVDNIPRFELFIHYFECFHISHTFYCLWLEWAWIREEISIHFMKQTPIYQTGKHNFWRLWQEEKSKCKLMSLSRIIGSPPLRVKLHFFY